MDARQHREQYRVMLLSNYPVIGADTWSSIANISPGAESPLGEDGSILGLSMTRIELPQVEIVEFRTVRTVTVDSPAIDRVRFVFQLAASGVLETADRSAAASADGLPLVIHPGTIARYRLAEGSQILSLRVAPAALQHGARLLFPEAPAADPPRFDILEEDSRAGAVLLRNAILQFCNEMNATDLSRLPSAAGVFERDLLQRILLYWPSNYNRTTIARGPANVSAEFQRALSFLIGNPGGQLSASIVAQAAGTSARSLHRMVRHETGLSFAVWVRNVRLALAHEKLLLADTDESVIRVALRCGFASPGHFSRHYRRRFGELPSDTLERSRQQR